jgi:hypothetical protein
MNILLTEKYEHGDMLHPDFEIAAFESEITEHRQVAFINDDQEKLLARK